MNPLPSKGFTSNIKFYFLWKTMKKYLWMSSAAVLIGALRVNLKNTRKKKKIDEFANKTVDPDETSFLGLHCLPCCAWILKMISLEETYFEILHLLFFQTLRKTRDTENGWIDAWLQCRKLQVRIWVVTPSDLNTLSVMPHFSNPGQIKQWKEVDELGLSYAVS